MDQNEIKQLIEEEATYVYSGTEVVLTGRFADKTNQRGNKNYLFEVKSTDEHGPTFVKWVRMSELHKIQGERK
ncbi:hypothetical protein LCGC14_0999610 [marine sediment metagenome]|uniref:Uncharacterized protein n=1 Tax=marine sediment metagenome TaxID=412755 RepID=A0A0F9NPX8_9ZZZZ